MLPSFFFSLGIFEDASFFPVPRRCSKRSQSQAREAWQGAVDGVLGEEEVHATDCSTQYLKKR